MYFLSVPFSRTSITCGTDGILFPKGLRGMKRQMINKEDASDKNIIYILTRLDESFNVLLESDVATEVHRGESVNPCTSIRSSLQTRLLWSGNRI